MIFSSAVPATQFRGHNANLLWTSGVGLLAQYSYDGLGRRINVAYGNGTTRAYTYDPVSRLASIQLTFPNAASYNDTIGPFTYTPSSQIASLTKSNDAFAWMGHVAVTRPYTTNGLNQYTVSGGVALGYDGRGNLNASGTATYTSDGLNRLTGTSAGVTIGYDPAQDRVDAYTVNATSTYLYYAGSALTAETNGTSITQRYVPGPGTDEPIVWYSGGTTAGRQFLQADERGSVIAVTNSAGAMVGHNSYDEFGIPAIGNVGRFQYTGQTWFGEVGLYYYKARWYSPSLGRFWQTDPIGYGDGLNFYNYGHSDPINRSDPAGLDDQDGTGGNGAGGGGGGGGVPATTGPEIVVDGAPPPPPPSDPGLSLPQLPGVQVTPVGFGPPQSEIVVVGRRSTPQNTDRGRPDYCFSRSYVIGGVAQGISNIVTGVGLAASVLGAPEVGLPLAAVGSAIGLGGSYLQDRAAGQVISFGTALNAGTTALTAVLPVAKGGEVAAAFVAQGLGMVRNAGSNYVQGTNPCD